jgi:AbrB family looped-hinge helix DNA binding protein
MDKNVVKLGANGRVVIPAEYRKALGLSEGDDLLLRLEDGELRLSSRAAAIRRAQAIVRRRVPEGVSLSGELIEERRAEAEREGRGP